MNLSISHYFVFILCTLSIVTSYAAEFNDNYVEYGHTKDTATDLNKGFLIRGSHQFKNTVIVTGGYRVTDNDVSYERKLYEFGVGKNIPMNDKSDITLKASTHYFNGEYTPPSLSTEKTTANFNSISVGARGLLTKTTRASVGYTSQISCGSGMDDNFLTLQVVRDLTKNFHLVAEAVELTNNDKISRLNILLRHSF
ncbi:MAG: hypothetical protein P8L86_03155 [Gammaproteobacteria bacterium]|nr:hypothetical protein [Gammaproteobacteria bacterium]